MKLHDQTLCFLYAVLLGLIYGGAWDVNNLIRGGRRRSVLGVVLDCLFCLAVSVSFFLFALRWSGGQIRGFTLMGIGLGAALYFLSLRDIFMALLRPVCKIWALLCKIPIKFHRFLQKFR